MTGLLALPFALAIHAARAGGDKAMRRCTIHDPATIAALKSGRKRIAVVVRAFRPPEAGSAAMVVSLVAQDSSRRLEVARLAVHPPRAFGGKAEPHRFLVSLEGQGAFLRAGAPVCIEVSFANAAATGIAGGASADIEVEVVDLPGAP